MHDDVLYLSWRSFMNALNSLQVYEKSQKVIQKLINEQNIIQDSYQNASDEMRGSISPPQPSSMHTSCNIWTDFHYHNRASQYVYDE